MNVDKAFIYVIEKIYENAISNKNSTAAQVAQQHQQQKKTVDMNQTQQTTEQNKPCCS